MDILIKTPQTKVWGLCNWATGKLPKYIPSLKGSNRMVIDPANQAQLFATTFFPSTVTTTPHALLTDPPPCQECNLPDITPDELLYVLQKTSNISALEMSSSSWHLIKWVVTASPNIFT